MKKQWYLSATVGLTLGYFSTLAILSSPVEAQTFALSSITSAVAALPTTETVTESATYTVVLGNTLYGISRRKGLLLTDLIAFNRDTVPDPDLIRVGQILQLGASTRDRGNVQISRPVSAGRSGTKTYRHHRRKPLASRPASGQKAKGPIISEQPTPKVIPPKTTTAKTITAAVVQKKTPTESPSSPNLSDLSTVALAGRRHSILASLPTGKLSGNRVGAAKRFSCAADPTQRLVALLPDTNLGQTVADQPTFFWSIPEIKPEWQNRPRIGFKLNKVDAKDEDIDPPVYETEFDSGPSGINSLTVPQEIPVGENLRWTLKIICDSNDPYGIDSTDYIKGWIRRVQPSPELSAELEKANLVDYPAIYAKAGLWFDSLRYLSAIRRKVGDESIGDDWAALLKQVNLGDLANKPMTCQQNQSASGTGCAAVP